MTKTYQIKINQGKDAKMVDIPQAGPKGEAVTVKAVQGARYQLVDPQTGFGPENIRASRQGKDLKVSFEGSQTTDLVVENYYAVTPEGYNGLIGEAESGRFYEYIPESAVGLASVPMLADSGQVVGMALGGAEVTPSGAAVGVLAAGLFSPWLLGAGALAAAAAGGGGGSGSGAAKDTTPPSGQTGALSPVAGSDSSTLGDDRTNVTKPTITGKAEAGSTLEVSFVDLAGKVTGRYTPTLDPSGNYSLVVPDNLADNSTDTKGTQYTPVIKATDASGNSSTANGKSFVVDTKAADVVAVMIDVDTSNDGYISAAEKGMATVSTLTAKLDKDKVTDFDVVIFKLSDGTTIDTVKVDTSKVINDFVVVTSTKMVKLPAEGASVAVKAVLVDAAGNESPTPATDTAAVVQESLKTALTINPITGDNFFSIKDQDAGSTVTLTGKVSGSFAVDDVVTLSINGKTYKPLVDKNGNYSQVIPKGDLIADVDSIIEGSVTGTHGQLATAAQSYVVETASNAGKATGLYIDAITSDNILNIAESLPQGLVITGKVTGKFAAGTDVVNVWVDGHAYTSAPVQSDGAYSIAVDTKYLLTDGDTTVDASVTGTGGTTAKALQNYGFDILAPDTLALTIDLDNGNDVSKYKDDRYINSSEKGKESTTSLTASFDPTKVSIGDVITFSDGTTTKTVTLDKGAVDAGSATSTGWKLPLENGGKLNVTAVLTDAAGNTSKKASDDATIDITAATVTAKSEHTNFKLDSFGFDSDETGTYKLHIGNLVFTELTLPAGGKSIVGTDTPIQAKDIFFEHWDVAGNLSTTYLIDVDTPTVYTVTSNTTFVV
jgi:hypothetical protein